jgi:hypothetical protein
MHIGKNWPVYRPALLFWAGEDWPNYPPTELAWTFGGWVGARAAGAPVSGRGMVPTTWVAPGAPPVYELTATNSAGDVLAVRLGLVYDASTGQNSFAFTCTCNGVDQITGGPGPPTTGTVWYDFDFVVGSSTWTLAPGYVCAPISLIVQAYTWRMPPPKPPLSSPF